MTEQTNHKKAVFQHAFAPDILREYDIRGIVGQSLSEQDAYAVGRGFGSIIRRDGGKKIVVGYDGRATSPAFAQQAQSGLKDCGLDVIDIGLGPSPYTYFAMHHANADAGLMITGSHNPPAYNGFKMVRKTSVVYGDQIQKIGAIVRDGDVESGHGTLIKQDCRDEYVARLLQDFIPAKGKPLTVVWDNGNGAAGEIIRRLTAKMEGQHHLLYDEIDGTFPNHHPDPTVAENLIDLQNAVTHYNADLGVAFDGDADRIGVVTATNRIIWCDQLLAIYAADILPHYPKNTPIVADVKSSQVLYDEIARLGGKPIMWKTGHSMIKAKMAEVNSPVSGEFSGHIFFKDNFYGHDDGVYCAMRLLSIINKTGKNADALLAHLPIVFNTPEIRFEVDEDYKFQIIEDIKNTLIKDKSLNINMIDGMRVNTAKGWWLLRASNTQNVLVIRAESQNKNDLWDLQKTVIAVLEQHKITVPDALRQRP